MGPVEGRKESEVWPRHNGLPPLPPLSPPMAAVGYASFPTPPTVADRNSGRSNVCILV